MLKLCIDFPAVNVTHVTSYDCQSQCQCLCARLLWVSTFLGNFSSACLTWTNANVLRLNVNAWHPHLRNRWEVVDELLDYYSALDSGWGWCICFVTAVLFLAPWWRRDTVQFWWITCKCHIWRDWKHDSESSFWHASQEQRKLLVLPQKFWNKKLYIEIVLFGEICVKMTKGTQGGALPEFFGPFSTM